MSEEIAFPRGFDEHRRQQIRAWAKETTPEQRLQWLQQSLEFAYSCGIDVLGQKRQLDARRKTVRLGVKDSGDQVAIAEAWRKRREIDEFLQEERRQRDWSMPIAEAIAQFDGAFRYSLTLPPRTTSGLVEWYKALKKVR